MAKFVAASRFWVAQDATDVNNFRDLGCQKTLFFPAASRLIWYGFGWALQKFELITPLL